MAEKEIFRGIIPGSLEQQQQLQQQQQQLQQQQQKSLVSAVSRRERPARKKSVGFRPPAQLVAVGLAADADDKLEEYPKVEDKKEEEKEEEDEEVTTALSAAVEKKDRSATEDCSGRRRRAPTPPGVSHRMTDVKPPRLEELEGAGGGGGTQEGELK